MLQPSDHLVYKRPHGRTAVYSHVGGPEGDPAPHHTKGFLGWILASLANTTSESNSLMWSWNTVCSSRFWADTL